LYTNSFYCLEEYFIILKILFLIIDLDLYMFNLSMYFIFMYRHYEPYIFLYILLLLACIIVAHLLGFCNCIFRFNWTICTLLSFITCQWTVTIMF
jgi:hypothetical protein